MKHLRQHLPTISIVALTLVAAFLRLWRIDETFYFLGDQGRDALIVADIFRKHDPVFIGPVTSVGNMYLGPLYYYFMLPFLWLSYPSPLGPVIAVALLGIATVPLLYVLFRKYLGERVALLAAFLLAFNVPAIELSRYSWNPNPAPFVATLWLYFLIRVTRGKHWSWFWVGVLCAVLMQLHYVTAIAIGVSGVVWLYQAVLLWKQKKLKALLWPTLFAMGAFLAFQIPLVLFDWRHDGLNFQALQKLLSGEDAFGARSNEVSRLSLYMESARQRMELVVVKLFLGVTQATGALLALCMLVSTGVLLIREKTKQVFVSMGVILFTLVLSVLILGAYKNDVYTHYIAFLIPPLVLMYGYLLAKLSRVNHYIAFVIGAFLFFYVLGGMTQLSWHGSGPSMTSLQNAADSVHERLAPNEPYAILLLAEHKDTYGMNYRYYLSLDAAKRPVDPEGLPHVNKLVVIQEDLKLENPLETELYELQVFDVATPSATWQLENGPRFFILEKPPADGV